MINKVSLFLASSSELRRERLLIGNRVRMLNDEWEPLGVHIVLNIWEDYAPEFTGERKQTEYDLNLVDKSDIVFGLFCKLCGKYSQEEVLRAYGNNSDSLHCYRLPAVDDAAVRSFEKSSGITIEPVADIEGVWQKIKNSTEEYITSHYAVSNSACPMVKEQIYATIGADLRTEEDELGNMIRAVDMMAEKMMGMRCRLLPMMDCRNIVESDYYMALLNNVLDDQSRAEFVTAYDSKKRNDHPFAIAPFQKMNGTVTRYDADNEVSRLMLTSGKEFFPIIYESLDTVKMTLLAHLLRKKQVLSPDVAFAMGDNQALYFGGWRIADTGKALGLKTEMVSEFKVHVELLELMMPTVPKLGMEASLRREISDLLSHDHLDVKEAKILIKKSSSLIALLRKNVNKGFYKSDYVLRMMLLRIACNDQYSNLIGETPDEYYKEFVDYADRHSIVDADVEAMRINFANAYARGGREDEALRLFGVVRSNLRRIDTTAKVLRPRLFLLYYNALATLSTIRQEVELNEWAEELEAMVEQWIEGDESLMYYRCYPVSFRIDVLSVDVLADENMLEKAEKLWKLLINHEIRDDNRFSWLQAIHGLTKSLARYYLDRMSVVGLAKEVVMGYAQKSLSYLDALIRTGEALPNGVIAAKATLVDFMDAYNVNLMNPIVLVGIFIGSMMAFLFCGLTMNAVGRAAQKMVEEVRRQFQTIKGILEGKADPDYARCVAISTKGAQHEMLLPSILAIIVPIITGLVLGVAGVLGLLIGGLATGFVLAVFMANAGGAWDNAKKYVEEGHFGGKGSDCHKATVVGDTVGDPFKDTSGPSLNILIKLMSMVSIVMAGLTVTYHLL